MPKRSIESGSVYNLESVTYTDYAAGLVTIVGAISFTVTVKLKATATKASLIVPCTVETPKGEPTTVFIEKTFVAELNVTKFGPPAVKAAKVAIPGTMSVNGGSVYERVEFTFSDCDTGPAIVKYGRGALTVTVNE